MKRFLMTEKLRGMLNRSIRGAAFIAMLAATSVSSADDWLQFRGNRVDGIAGGKAAPVEFGEEKNVAWKAELPGRGLSGPIVIGDRIVLTASSGFRQDQLHVLCFSAESGEQLWERRFWATGRTMCHRKMCVATPTPASDGERIFAFYSSNDLACLDLDGNLLWYRGLGHDFPNASNSLGMASSPIVAGNTVVVQVESDAESFAVGVDPATGLSRWKLDRPRAANWTSPVLIKGATPAEDQVLLQSSKGMTAIEPQTGKELWSYLDGASTIPSSVVAGRKILIPSNGLTAVEPVDGSEAPKVVWNASRLSPSTSSPLVLDGKVFTLNRSGALSCASLTDGDLAWQLRLKGPYSATPVSAGGLLYFFNEKGKVHVVKPGEKSGEIVGESDLEETILATPAVSDGAIFVRSDEHLWKIAETPEK